MYSRLAVVAWSAPALLLAACDPDGNRGLESVHQPVVSHSEYAVDLAMTSYGLGEGEAGRLASWMASLRPGYGDRIAVEDPSGSTGARRQVASEAAHYGLLLTEAAPATTGGVSPGTLRVVITRGFASVPSCPQADRFEPHTLDAHTASNHGCAINSNLAAMIARPDDLVRGQAGTGIADPVNATKAIEAYRSKPSIALGGPAGGATAGSSGAGGMGGGASGAGLGSGTTGTAGN